MKKVGFLVLLILFLTSIAFADTSPFNPQSVGSIHPAKQKEIRSKIGALQIPFIKNESQIKDGRVKFYANTFAGTVLVTDDEIVYGLREWSKEHGVRRGVSQYAHVGADPRVRPKGYIVKEKFLNAKKTEAIGIKKAETKVNYFQQPI